MVFREGKVERGGNQGNTGRRSKFRGILESGGGGRGVKNKTRKAVTRDQLISKRDELSRRFTKTKFPQ